MSAEVVLAALNKWKIFAFLELAGTFLTYNKALMCVRRLGARTKFTETSTFNWFAIRIARRSNALFLFQYALYLLYHRTIGLLNELTSSKRVTKPASVSPLFSNFGAFFVNFNFIDSFYRRNSVELSIKLVRLTRAKAFLFNFYNRIFRRLAKVKRGGFSFRNKFFSGRGRTTSLLLKSGGFLTFFGNVFLVYSRNLGLIGQSLLRVAERRRFTSYFLRSMSLSGKLIKFGAVDSSNSGVVMGRSILVNFKSKLLYLRKFFEYFTFSITKTDSAALGGLKYFNEKLRAYLFSSVRVVKKLRVLAYARRVGLLPRRD